MKNSSFITQSDQDLNDMFSDDEELPSSDEEQLQHEQPLETAYVTTPPISPLSHQVSPKKHLTATISSHRLMKQLLTKHEEKIQMIYTMNKTDLTESLQTSLEELQRYYEEKLTIKQQEIQRQTINYQEQLNLKENEINDLKDQLHEKDIKYNKLKEKFIQKQYKIALQYQSPYSLGKILTVWKQYTKRQKQIQKKDLIIQKLTKTYLLEKYFLLMVSQYQMNKKELMMKDLQFKYDTFSSEMVMKYENEFQQLKQELQEAYSTIQQEEKKRLLLEEEVRKLLMKNMTAMNTETLHLFQYINQSNNTFDNITLPSNTSTAQQPSEVNNNQSYNLEDSFLTATSDVSVMNRQQPVPPSTTTLRPPVQSSHPPSRDESPDSSVSPKPMPYNIAPSPFGATTIFKSNVPPQQPLQQQQRSYDPSPRPGSATKPNTVTRSGGSQLYNMNVANGGGGGRGEGGNKPNYHENSQEAYLAKLSEMYNRSVTATTNFALVPPQPPSQPVPALRNQNNAPKYQTATSSYSHRSQGNNTSTVQTPGSAQKGSKAGFGQTSGRFQKR